MPDAQIITCEMERINSRIFLLSYVLIYFAAPVLYVDVVQAGVLNRLGTSATIASLPTSLYLLSTGAPLILSWLIPHRYERATVVASYIVTALMALLVAVSLLFPFPRTIRISMIVLQGLVMGVTSITAQTFTLQCLARGSSLEGRARILRATFAATPVAAVIGSLTAQFLLSGGIPALRYPYDTAAVYLIALPCIGLIAWLSHGYRLIHIDDEPRPLFFAFLSDTVRGFIGTRGMLLLFFGYLVWYCTQSATSNLSLMTRMAMGRDPKEMSGLVLACRFGFKALGGYAFGWLTLRYGFRATIIAANVLSGAGVVWGFFARGYPFLFSFGLIGAGELGGTYYPNFLLAISPLTAGPRNLSILNLSTPLSSFAPATHGALTDAFGFWASILFAVLTTVLGVGLALALPAGKTK